MYRLLKAFRIESLTSQNPCLMLSKDKVPSQASLGKREIVSALKEFWWHFSRRGFGSPISATEIDMRLA